MKKLPLYLSCLCLAPAVAACTVNDGTGPDKLLATIHFTGVVPGGAKAMPYESSVMTLDVFVFNAHTGILEASSRQEAHIISIDVPTGVPIRYCVVANAPDDFFGHIADYDSFCSSLACLKDNIPLLMMFGSGSQIFDTDTYLNVELTRYVCKVSLEGITPSFMLGSQGSSQVKLRKIFLINVNSTCPLSGIPAAGDLWNNKLGDDSTLDTELRGILVCEIEKDITSDAKLTDTYDFYCCPNPVDNAVDSRTDPDWSPRHTRLVVELTIDDAVNYYPVTLPSMECNTAFIIKNLSLTGHGSDNPDIPVTSSGITFGITVNPWDPQSSAIVFQ